MDAMCIHMEEKCFGYKAVPPGNQLKMDIYNDIQAASLSAKKKKHPCIFQNAF